MSVDYADLIAAVRESTAGDWSLTTIHQGERNTVYRAERSGEVVGVKCYDDPARAEREFQVLTALRHFGINLAPEALLLDAASSMPLVVMSWLDGQLYEYPPEANDEESWHRFMSAMGVSNALNFAQYGQQIPLQGRGYMRPGDLMDDIARELAVLGSDHPLYERLAVVVAAMREKIAPDWNVQPKIGLCRCDPAIHNFMLEGCCHVLALDWEHADWGDVAAEVGLWNAHPDYEEVPSGQWVWLRWEFARLTHDEALTARATTYARLGQVLWAIRLAKRLTNADDSTPKRVIKQRDRYLNAVEKLFLAR